MMIGALPSDMQNLDSYRDNHFLTSAVSLDFSVVPHVPKTSVEFTDGIFNLN